MSPDLISRDKRSVASGRDYRALLTFEAGAETSARIVEQVAVWLREKRFDLDPHLSAHVVDDHRSLTVVHHETAAGRSLLVRLSERTPRQGTWDTELAAHVPLQHKNRVATGWLTLRVSNSLNRSAAVPRLATYLLDVLDVRDGKMPLLSQAGLVNVGGIEDLLDAVCDDRRHGLLFIAGSDSELDLAAWVSKVRLWTRDIRGTAQAAVLDPAATVEFNARVGRSHQVPPWTVRTFLPAVDLDWAADGRRHRILGTERLAHRSDHELRGLLASLARGHAAARPSPSAVSRVSRNLGRVADELVLEELLAGPRDVPDPGAAASDSAAAGGSELLLAPHPGDARREPTEPLAHDGVRDEKRPDRDGSPERQAAVLAEVARLLAVPDVTLEDLPVAIAAAQAWAAQAAERAVRQARLEADRSRSAAATAHGDHDRIRAELASRQERIAALEDEVDFYRELGDEEEFYRVLAEEERARAEDEARWLRQQLRRRGDYEAATLQLPEDRVTVYPDSFEELLTRRTELADAGVLLTGDQSITRALDDVDGNRKIVRAAWEALLLLADFIKARQAGDHDGNVEMYLHNTPSEYRSMSPKKHASGETGPTMEQYGHLRTFPVPAEVAPSGTACMAAHFKLGSLGMISPRLHYFNDYANTGKVYVGYIGPHLRTVTTN